MQSMFRWNAGQQKISSFFPRQQNNPILHDARKKQYDAIAIATFASGKIRRTIRAGGHDTVAMVTER